MKAMMMSIKPKYVSMILNKIKTIEVRKRFPIDYVGWVYIYNTKTTKDGVLKLAYIGNKLEFVLPYDNTSKYQGKVVARFWCDKVEEIKLNLGCNFFTKTLNEKELKEQACLNTTQLEEYLFNKNESFKCAYAIHITNLEIFDKPKEISEFKSKLHIQGGCKNCPQNTGFSMPYCATCDFLLPLNRAPQSWCYVEE